MALYSVTLDAVALVAGAAQTLIELQTGASTAIKVKQWWCEFDGTNSANTPAKVEFRKASVAVTAASAGTIDKVDPNSSGGTLTTAKITVTSEGAGTLSRGELHRVSPTSGIVIQYALGTEWICDVSGFWRLRVNAAQAVNATCGIIWEE